METHTAANERGPARLLQRMQRWIRGESESSVTISHRCLDQVSPFHLVVDRNGIVEHSGPSWDRLLETSPANQPLSELFKVEEGDQQHKGLNLDTPSSLEERAIQLKLQGDRTELTLVMQAIQLNENNEEHWLLDIRPNLESIEDLSSTGLSLQDLSLIDPLRSNMLELLMRESLQQELLSALHEQNN